MTIREVLNDGTKRLRKHRCAHTDAQRETEALLMHVSGLGREQFLSTPEKILSPVVVRRFGALITRRLHHEPLDYMLGTAWFHGREFAVNRSTLIPRPATESVVEAAIVAAREFHVTEAVDVGTGSGCIAVSLALELPEAHIMATDTSMSALRVTRRNAARHGVRDRILLRKMNLLGFRPLAEHASARSLPFSTTGTALIVANLPYVPTTMRKKLTACVLSEPASALFGGKDGLNPSRALVDQLVTLTKKLPNKKIILVFEILANQFVPLTKYIRNAFPVTRPERVKNYQNVTVGLIVRM